MMVSFKIIPLMLVVAISCLVGISKSQSTVPVVNGLSYSYYSRSCPDLDFIIRDHLFDVFERDITQAAGLLRLHFHDCFVKVYYLTWLSIFHLLWYFTSYILRCFISFPENINSIYNIIGMWWFCIVGWIIQYPKWKGCTSKFDAKTWGI